MNTKENYKNDQGGSTAQSIEISPKFSDVRGEEFVAADDHTQTHDAEVFQPSYFDDDRTVEGEYQVSTMEDPFIGPW